MMASDPVLVFGATGTQGGAVARALLLEGDLPYDAQRARAFALALAEAWGGLTLAYYTDWPTSFWITALSGLVYLSSLAVRFRAR